MCRTACVTGATGFLGLNLVRELVHQRWKVTGIDLPSERLSYLSAFDVEMRTADITDYPSVLAAIPEGCNVLFHTAASTSAWRRNNRYQTLVNVNGTKNVLRAAQARHIRKIIHTSSISAFGFHPGKRINEDTPSNALTCGMNYNLTKYRAEQLVKAAVSEGLPVVILNPCNIVGPYDTHNWAQLIYALNCSAIRVIPPGKGMFSHVRDVVDAHITAVDIGEPGENYLLGGAEGSFKEVFNEIERNLGKPLSRRVTAKRVIWLSAMMFGLKSWFDGKEPLVTPEKYNRLVSDITCDFSKAVRVLGFKVSPLAEMVADACRWLKGEGRL